MIPIRYGKFRILLPIITDFSSDNYQSLAADLPGPVNNTRTDTDLTDKIRIVTDRADKYGSPISSVRSASKCKRDLGIREDNNRQSMGI